MKVLMAGASGFLGNALADYLRAEGHEIRRLVRRDPGGADELRWDPYADRVDRGAVEGADVVVCLSGAPLAHWPWTEGYQKTFRDSRVRTTSTLARAIADSDRKPALLAQNGVAGYGDRGDVELTEESPTDADTFMGGVTRAWQDATTPASEAGARVVVMRSSVVLDGRGGALKPLSLVFKLGLGGPVGGGQQYFATISSVDWLRAVSHLAGDDDAQGAYNLSGPEPRTNAEFGATLGRLVHRPAVVPVPSFAVRAAANAVASELLNSTRVVPARLLADGFTFEHPTLEDQLTAALA